MAQHKDYGSPKSAALGLLQFSVHIQPVLKTSPQNKSKPFSGRGNPAALMVPFNCSQNWSPFIARNWLAGQDCQCSFCHPVKITSLHSSDKEIYHFNTIKLKSQFLLSQGLCETKHAVKGCLHGVAHLKANCIVNIENWYRFNLPFLLYLRNNNGTPPRANLI